MNRIPYLLLISVLLGMFVVPVCVLIAEILGYQPAGWVVGPVLSLGFGCYALWEESHPRVTLEAREHRRPEGMMDDLLDSLERGRSPRP